MGKAAALQYDGEFNKCDHTRRPTIVPKCKTKRHIVEVPSEANVLRRFPWGSRSLGSAEYRDDMHLDQTGCTRPDQAIAQAGAARRAAANTYGGARYIDRFHVNASGAPLVQYCLLSFRAEW